MRREITEFVYTWPNGREEVRYRRDKDSEGALELIAEVLDLQRIHGDFCPYSFRHIEVEDGQNAN